MTVPTKAHQSEIHKVAVFLTLNHAVAIISPFLIMWLSLRRPTSLKCWPSFANTRHALTWDLLKFFIICELNMIWRWNLHQLTSLAKPQKLLRSSWLEILGNQLIDRSPYTRYTDHKCYLPHNNYLNMLMNFKWTRMCSINKHSRGQQQTDILTTLAE